MNIILDSNIVFSALIKDSLTRKIILDSNLNFFFPEIIYQELKKYESHIIKKSKLNKKEYLKLLNTIIKKTILIKTTEVLKELPIAINIIKDIDIKDRIFIACALKYETILWSDDKALKQQNKIIIMNTQEIKEFIQQ